MELSVVLLCQGVSWSDLICICHQSPRLINRWRCFLQLCQEELAETRAFWGCYPHQCNGVSYGQLLLCIILVNNTDSLQNLAKWCVCVAFCRFLASLNCLLDVPPSGMPLALISFRIAAKAFAEQWGNLLLKEFNLLSLAALSSIMSSDSKTKLEPQWLRIN